MISRIKNKFKRKILASTKEVKFGKGSFKLSVNNEHEEMRANTFHTKEPEMIEWVNSFSDDSVFYDIGANIGIYSLYASIIHDKINVYSFEPESQNFSKLCKNIFDNKLQNVKPYQIGISDETKFDILNIAVMESGAGAATLEEQYLNSFKTIFQQGIFSIKLDDIVFKHKFPIPKYIKIDVDGIEKKILYGAKNVLSSDECQELLVEFNFIKESDNNSIFKYLEEFGFRLIKESEWTSEFNESKSKNFIFKKFSLDKK
ncbi:FkbM family methyltransferase [Aliarcobacter cryaerophilus]|uniref:FkbM family methyltransferase n=1 Tax=Aliarcobacter cryaerophilus TaxID=28198 RepID=UPI0021B455B9|nr:FkbM family methyltransferase [Aliarcobacter cryaerophilus]MCT7511868.1 FkbM family methyltransferase [Aliarcobacter cryaerophilus]